MNILTVPADIVVSLSSDKCTYWKSLWIKASAKCECKCVALQKMTHFRTEQDVWGRDKTKEQEGGDWLLQGYHYYTVTSYGKAKPAQSVSGEPITELVVFVNKKPFHNSLWPVKRNKQTLLLMTSSGVSTPLLRTTMLWATYTP